MPKIKETLRSISFYKIDNIPQFNLISNFSSFFQLNLQAFEIQIKCFALIL
jgi:hypothetical protein